ncbi:transposase [Streptomyces sp. NBC_00513]|uniref:transposase n=1 Tax=Streptomyces sp. NBC_00513 TaxID=2975763 RepID=UPI00352CA0A9
MPPPLLPRLQTSPPTRAEAAAGLRPQPRPTPKTRRVVRWIMTNPQHLTAADVAELKEIRMACPHLDAAARHVHDFAEMLHHLRGDQFPDWMERVLADDLPALHSLVSGLRRDLDTVTAGLSTPWSSGQVEGQVTRVKLIKRMAYGRANLDFLRQRILLAPCPCDITRSPTEPVTPQNPASAGGYVGQRELAGMELPACGTA